MSMLKKLRHVSWKKAALTALVLTAIILVVWVSEAARTAAPTEQEKPVSTDVGNVDSKLSGSASEPVKAPTQEEIWTDDPSELSTETYTLPEQAEMEDGSLGVLSIERLGLSVDVFETEDEMEAMTKGAAHFKITSAWDGNIGLCAHNVNFDGSDGFFKDLHMLKAGDSITYTTELGERTYEVTFIGKIDQDDWSYLVRTDDNRITLITCISGQPEKRLCVQAVEKN